MDTPLSHSNHYSNAPYIYFYLARINPFTNGMIKFQGNTFEIPERQFISIYTTIQLCTSTSNNRESIPDIFETPEIFYNINYNDLGKSVANKREHNVKLIPYANNGIEYCYDSLDDINNNIEINNNINKWIDFIFGINQYTNNNKEINFRRFNNEFYPQNSNFKKQIMDLKNNKMEDKNIYVEVKGNIDSPLNFGITPYQILPESAPKKNLTNQNLNDNKEKEDEIFNLKDIKNNANTNNVVYFEINKKNKNINLNLNNDYFSLDQYLTPYSQNGEKMFMTKTGSVSINQNQKDLLEDYINNYLFEDNKIKTEKCIKKNIKIYNLIQNTNEIKELIKSMKERKNQAKSKNSSTNNDANDIEKLFQLLPASFKILVDNVYLKKKKASLFDRSIFKICHNILDDYKELETKEDIFTLKTRPKSKSSFRAKSYSKNI
jgi:hypothetical protein